MYHDSGRYRISTRVVPSPIPKTAVSPPPCTPDFTSCVARSMAQHSNGRGSMSLSCAKHHDGSRNASEMPLFRWYLMQISAHMQVARREAYLFLIVGPLQCSKRMLQICSAPNSARSVCRHRGTRKHCSALHEASWAKRLHARSLSLAYSMMFV